MAALESCLVLIPAVPAAEKKRIYDKALNIIKNITDITGGQGPRCPSWRSPLGDVITDVYFSPTASENAVCDPDALDATIVFHRPVVAKYFVEIAKTEFSGMKLMDPQVFDAVVAHVHPEVVATLQTRGILEATSQRMKHIGGIVIHNEPRFAIKGLMPQVIACGNALQAALKTSATMTTGSGVPLTGEEGDNKGPINGLKASFTKQSRREHVDSDVTLSTREQRMVIGQDDSDRSPSAAVAQSVAIEEQSDKKKVKEMYSHTATLSCDPALWNYMTIFTRRLTKLVKKVAEKHRIEISDGCDNGSPSISGTTQEDVDSGCCALELLYEGMSSFVQVKELEVEWPAHEDLSQVQAEFPKTLLWRRASGRVCIVGNSDAVDSECERIIEQLKDDKRRHRKPERHHTGDVLRDSATRGDGCHGSSQSKDHKGFSADEYARNSARSVHQMDERTRPVQPNDEEIDALCTGTDFHSMPMHSSVFEVGMSQDARKNASSVEEENIPSRRSDEKDAFPNPEGGISDRQHGGQQPMLENVGAAEGRNRRNRKLKPSPAESEVSSYRWTDVGAGNDGGGGAPRCEPRGFRMETGTVILVHKADITKMSVEVIVNAANERLEHIGGVALAIARGAGIRLEDESRQYIRQHGAIQTSQCIATTAGNLPCSQVLHAVGPIWNARPDNQSFNLLKATFNNILTFAYEMGIDSIAVSAVSSGTYGAPLEAVAMAIIQSVYTTELQYQNRPNSISLKEVHFVDISTRTVGIIQRAFDDVLRGRDSLWRSVDEAEVRRSIDARFAGGPFRSGQAAADRRPDGEQPQERTQPQSTVNVDGWGDEVSVPRPRQKQALRQGDPAADNKQEAESSICCSEINNRKVLEKCKHAFCAPCIDTWFTQKPTCAVCGQSYEAFTGNYQLWQRSDNKDAFPNPEGSDRQHGGQQPMPAKVGAAGGGNSRNRKLKVSPAESEVSAYRSTDAGAGNRGRWSDSGRDSAWSGGVGAGSHGRGFDSGRDSAWSGGAGAESHGRGFDTGKDSAWSSGSVAGSHGRGFDGGRDSAWSGGAGAGGRGRGFDSGRDSAWSGGAGAGSRGGGGAPRCEPRGFRLETGTVILVHKADITKMSVEVIVNAANDRLEHVGGLALAIARGAGTRLQDESRQYIRQHGAIQTSQCTATTAGNLPCSQVLHAVGPMWNRRPDDQSFKLLKATFSNILTFAYEMGIDSIAVPAVSSGIYGAPLEAVAMAIVQSVFTTALQYQNRPNPISLKEVHFVDISPRTVGIIQRAFDDVIRGRDSPWRSVDEAEVRRSIDARFAGGPFRSGQAAADKRPDVEQPQERTQPQTTVNVDGWGDGASVPRSRQKQALRQGDPAADNKQEAECSICCSEITNRKVLEKCKHAFCAPCIDTWFAQKPTCPVCGQAYGAVTGNQPDGTMNWSSHYVNLPGYPGCRTIVIQYQFPSGIQTAAHPSPGKPYTGTSRTAYLPDNAQGRQVLRMLKMAFDAKLTFTIGTSVPTGANNTVTWNDIHHKTSNGNYGIEYGYPDPGYLNRVTEELAAKGIK